MLGAVDLGTNTVRILVGKVVNGAVEPRDYFRRITRLGGGFSPSKGLAPEAMERTLCALREGAVFLRQASVARVRGVGTEILRAADQGADFIRCLALETGIELEVIDGLEEARLTTCGVLSALAPRPKSCLVFDIGGGSTEFVLWRQEPIFSCSYPLGVVRLAEDEAAGILSQKQIDLTLSALHEELLERELWNMATALECQLVGTAGTVTTLAALQLQMKSYDWRRVNNLALGYQDLQRLLERLEPMPAGEREKLPGMEKGRGDLIVPGLRIVLSVMNLFGRRTLTVSDFGLLEGILVDLDEQSRA